MYVMIGGWSLENIDLFLPGDEVPIIYQPGLQFLWDLHLYLHTIGESLLLVKQNVKGIIIRLQKVKSAIKNWKCSKCPPAPSQTHTKMPTLSTVGSTRALFFRGGCGISPVLVPSPAPGAKKDGNKDGWSIQYNAGPKKCMRFIWSTFRSSEGVTTMWPHLTYSSVSFSSLSWGGTKAF